MQTKDQHLGCGVRQCVEIPESKSYSSCYRPSLSGIALLGVVSKTLGLPG
jgi:hypothetical protein